MKKIIFFVFTVILSANTAFSTDNCFISIENSVVFEKEGDCTIRYSPCSSFKIPLAIMGFDAGVLKDETNPEWPFKPEYDSFLESWKQPQNPRSWIKNGCVWYSQVLTPQLGIEKFHDYVKKFNYGNQDIAGDKGKDNGLTNAWLSSSLEISPEEQIVFLEKLLSDKLPVTPHAQSMTRKILYVDDLTHGWKLYGKTGSGYLLSSDRTQKLERKHGWFIGWIEKDNRKIIFVNHIVDGKKEETHAGPRAKEQAKEKMIKIIDQIEEDKK